MKNNLTIYSISKWLALIFGVVGIVLWMLLAFFFEINGVNDIDNAPMQCMFILAYILFSVAFLLVLYSAIKGSMTSSKSLKQALVYFGLFIAIFVVSYLLAMSEPTATEVYVSTGLYAFYTMLVLATLILLYTGIKNALTK